MRKVWAVLDAPSGKRLAPFLPEIVDRLIAAPVVDQAGVARPGFINYHLLASDQQQEITFTRSRSGNKHDGAHVEQKNWAVVRRTRGLSPPQ